MCIIVHCCAFPRPPVSCVDKISSCLDLYPRHALREFRFSRHDVNGFVHVMHYVNSIFHVMVSDGLVAAVEQVHGHDVNG